MKTKAEILARISTLKLIQEMYKENNEQEHEIVAIACKQELEWVLE